jgi:benzylsuccinate CoA-transferase BbsF subunit
MAAAATISALLYRRRTGRGQHVEVAQWEAFLSYVGEMFIETSMTGAPPPRRGNGHSSMAPHGAYRCEGDDAWLTIAVATDAEFAALCRVIDRPDLVQDPRFADVVSRYHHRDELDEVVAAWTATQVPREAASLLQAAGVSAMPVLTVPELVEDPHLAERGFFEDVTHREAGTYLMDGPAWRFRRTPAHVRLPAPCFGEHNDYVFRDLLGLSSEDLAQLERDGIVTSAPASGQDE